MVKADELGLDVTVQCRCAEWNQWTGLVVGQRGVNVNMTLSAAGLRKAVERFARQRWTLLTYVIPFLGPGSLSWQV